LDRGSARRKATIHTGHTDTHTCL